ncbi:hypothetical protein [Acidipila rosea]|uniref:Uncharacterized protein n=1 Tax=Acidipila rosea TaxID=768535 RepID=A0A4R1LDT1_9BACT|nr:hypothetical protein [Acidipila rosea]MBW4025812.1 hypothetical protein [Acidobacteriota bacterium]MBW4044269.1 hypothetical protein [Acidobacteriota bacterium]TCK75700.1 hypothetical protein C7378_0691 [Acidipila rosea]
MATLTLIIGVILLGIGVLGHRYGTRRRRVAAPDELMARKWVMTIGSVIVALWFVAFSAAHLLHYSHSGRW